MENLKQLNKRFHFNKLAEYFFATQINFFGPAFAYYSLLALVPTVIVIGMSFSIFGVGKELIVTGLERLLPNSVEEIILPIVKQALNDPNIIWFATSWLIFFWTIGSILGILRQTFNRIYGYKEIINDFFSRFIGFFWFMIVIAIFAVLMIITALGSNVIENLLKNVGTPVIFDQILIYFLFFGMYLLLCLINYFLPVKRPMWRFTLIGTIIELLLFVALNKGFNIWVQYSINRYSFFQALSAVIILLLYLNLVGIILTSGQVFIAWLQYNYKNKDSHEKNKSLSQVKK